jgi:hypothetical protein
LRDIENMQLSYIDQMMQEKTDSIESKLEMMVKDVYLRDMTEEENRRQVQIEMLEKDPSQLTAGEDEKLGISDLISASQLHTLI